jgi:CelD/BcsL family acetyltransferase involved in cellulose biosynthesis
MAMFRAALDEDRVSRIDYGTGDDGYKRDWMRDRSTLWRVEAFNPASLAGLAGAARAGLSALVRRVRSR